MITTMKIANRVINDNSPSFIIAELSANHNHKFDVAVETIKAAAKAGTDAIKIQTYTADTITIDSDKDYFKIKGGLWDGNGLYQLYEMAYTPWEWQADLMRIANEEGLICFSSPFDFSAIDFLEDLNVPAYKVSSFEIQDLPLIEHMAKNGKPMIMSTGIATMTDIEDAVNACFKVGNHEVALLKCTSAYPADFDEANIQTIPDMKERFKTVVGLSDHTLGHSVPVAAVALGAKIIEKHFILDKNIDSPDAAFSMDPDEFTFMVKSIREVESALGQVNYDLSEKVQKNKVFGRSLFVVEDIKAGDEFTSRNVRSIRPGHGLHPKFYPEVLGKKAECDIERGTPLAWTMVV